MNKALTSDEIQEKIDALRDCQERLQDIVGELRELARGDGWAKNYIVCPIEVATSDEHEWVTHDPSIDTWIKQLEDQIGEDDDSEAA